MFSGAVQEHTIQDFIYTYTLLGMNSYKKLVWDSPDPN